MSKMKEWEDMTPFEKACWKRKMNPTTKKFNPEWAKAYINGK